MFKLTENQEHKLLELLELLVTKIAANPAIAIPLQFLIICIVIIAFTAIPIALQSQINNQDTSHFENCPYERVKI